jgi:hypothetical protein
VQSEKDKLIAKVNAERAHVYALTARLRDDTLAPHERQRLTDLRAGHTDAIRKAEDRLAEIERERRAGRG